MKAGAALAPHAFGFLKCFGDASEPNTKQRRRPKASFPRPVPLAVKSAIEFFREMLLGWDRVCPMVADFGPGADAEIHGWVDASTTDG